MDLLAELEASRQNVTILEGRISALTTELTTANATVASNVVELAAAQERITAEQGATAVQVGLLSTANATIETHVATIAARDARITELETAARTAEQLALERTGRGGRPVNKKPSGAAATTQAEALKEYNAITDPHERAAYYAAHHETLFPKKK